MDQSRQLAQVMLQGIGIATNRRKREKGTTLVRSEVCDAEQMRLSERQSLAGKCLYPADSGVDCLRTEQYD